MRCISLCGILLCLLVVPAGAQSDIHPVFKYAWGENIGWTNWRDANSTSDGVAIHGTYLDGYIWAENVGWFHVGDGTPAGGTHYANADDTDYGVNIDASDDLFGLAWGENVGWINFDTRSALGPHAQQARLDGSAHRLRGYVWGENIGWINLDDAVHFVAACPACPGDLDGDDVRDLTDFTLFAAAYGSVLGNPNYDPCADMDDDGVVDLTDFGLFAAGYGVPCP
jgi:hypothetical protein